MHFHLSKIIINLLNFAFMLKIEHPSSKVMLKLEDNVIELDWIEGKANNILKL